MFKLSQKYLDRLFPYQKETVDKWWHRLAKVIFILFCIIIPAVTWMKVAVSEFDQCYNVFLVNYSNGGSPMLIRESDQDYEKNRANYAECISSAKLSGLIVVIVNEVLFFLISDILYYRILLYIIFGSAKKKT